MREPRMIPFSYEEAPPDEMAERAAAFRDNMRRRRSVREFDSRPVPRGVIEDCLRAAGSAPSGANCQPWHFVAVNDPAVKKRIRQGAEEVERAFYEGKAGPKWLADLEKLGTTADKPFLEVAPWLIVIFERLHELSAEGETSPVYYRAQSVGIASGILLTALHRAGLACLTYTPAPMDFLSSVCDRPRNERPYMIIVTGYPEAGATVPDLDKRPLEEIATFL